MATRTTKNATKKVAVRKKTTSKTSVSSPVVEKTSTKSNSSIKQYITKRNGIILLAIFLLAFAIYFFRDLFVAATVNGQPISRLQVVQELEKQNGKQTLESLVTKNLILQEMEKKNITVTNEEVTSEIKKIESALKAQNRSLSDALSQQGLSRPELEDQLKIQKMIEKLFSKDAVVSDKEVNAYIEKNKDALPTDQEESALKATIKEQLKQQKLTTKFQSWLEGIQKQAKINYYVKY